ncbi:uncharacterized protein LOC117112462 [Anneissia japonica]|uniref:uncharacterized protein LOC117112462 n=1 Tax=Anneissia japonica TaxID=1529436 RepID=UPI0014256AF2|nr:uncharacterized protein LOC117112462 [Anneissia japonica]
MSDIESMFYQVRVPDADSDFLRFLWYKNSDRLKPITGYRMKVHLFGATSPICSSYALRTTATSHALHYSKEAVDTILKNIYVDDCLKSVSSTSESIALATEVTKLCAEGGFHLTKWISNDREFMNSILEEERAKNIKDINLDIDKLPTDRALGVKYNTENDQFRYNINLKQKPLSRRGILSAVSSIYDPLGFVAAVTLRAKGILQDLCKEIGLGRRNS